MQVEHSVTAGVALVTLVNPERRNALTPAMATELIQVLDVLDADTSVGAVVITGAGKGFCAGADLTTLTAAALPRCPMSTITAWERSIRRS